jgi:hypothetical protein
MEAQVLARCGKPKWNMRGLSVNRMAATLALGLAIAWIAPGGVAIAGGGCADVSAYERGQSAGDGSVGVPPTSPGSPVEASAKSRRGPIHRLMAHSHIISWIRTATASIFLNRSWEPREATSGPPIDLVDPCSGPGAAHPQKVPVAGGRPLKQDRPERSVAARFEYAFATNDQSPGAKSIARELAARGLGAVPGAVSAGQK